MQEDSAKQSLFQCEVLPRILENATPSDVGRYQGVCRLADRRVRVHQKYLARAEFHELSVEATSDHSILMDISKESNGIHLFDYEIDGHDLYIHSTKKGAYRLYSKQNPYAEKHSSLAIFREDPSDSLRFCLEPILCKASFNQLSLVDVYPADFDKLTKYLTTGHCPIQNLHIIVGSKFEQPGLQYPSLMQMISNTGCKSFTSFNFTLPEDFWKYPQMKEMTHIEIHDAASSRISSHEFLQMNKCAYFEFEDGETNFDSVTIEALLKAWCTGERELESMVFTVKNDMEEITELLEDVTFTENIKLYEEDPCSTFYIGRTGVSGTDLLEITTATGENYMKMEFVSATESFLLQPEELLPLPENYTPFA